MADAKRQKLWKVFVTVSAEAQDAVSEVFSSVFSEPAVSYTDFDTRLCTVTIFTPVNPGTSGAWRDKIKLGIERISRAGLRTAPARIGCARVRREDWAESWKRHFRAIEIGDSLRVIPSWMQRRAVRGQALVILDPGLSFGTGQHPTTAFCLRQLVRTRRKGARTCLDMGTGSGILAIAAVKLGFQTVHAFDNDPDSIRVARQNARANGVGRRIRFWLQDLEELVQRSECKYDLVCANLIANLLIENRDRILARVAPGGWLVLAGILKSEFREVQAVYENRGLKLVSSQAHREWRSGAFGWKA